MQKQKNYNFITLLYILLMTLTPTMSWARLVAQTEVVSGTIVQISDNYSVKLDNEQVYTPSRETLRITLKPGDLVTLRYYVVHDTDKKIFFEYMPGKDSIPLDKPRRHDASERTDK